MRDKVSGIRDLRRRARGGFDTRECHIDPPWQEGSILLAPPNHIPSRQHKTK